MLKMAILCYAHYHSAYTNDDDLQNTYKCTVFHYMYQHCIPGSLCETVQGIFRLIAPLVRAAFKSAQLNVGHRRLEHWVGITWKCMHSTHRKRETGTQT